MSSSAPGWIHINFETNQLRINQAMRSRSPDWIHMKFDYFSNENHTRILVKFDQFSIKHLSNNKPWLDIGFVCVCVTIHIYIYIYIYIYILGLSARFARALAYGIILRSYSMDCCYKNILRIYMTGSIYGSISRHHITYIYHRFILRRDITELYRYYRII